MRQKVEDDPRPGRQATVTTQETTDKVHDMILTDWWITQQNIATQLGITQNIALVYMWQVFKF